MNADFDELPWDSEEIEPPTIVQEITERKCRVHRWVLPVVNLTDRTYTADAVCSRCGKVKDEARSKRGFNSRKRGNSLERWVNGLLGISNRGKYGGPDDGGGEADWIVVQTKSGNYFPRLIDRWLRAVPQRAGQMRGVVLVETPGPGTKRRALLVVDLYDAASQWGNASAVEDAT